MILNRLLANPISTGKCLRFGVSKPKTYSISRSLKTSSFFQKEWEGIDSEKLLSKTTPDSVFKTKKDNIYTVPNALSMSRIIAAPFLGYLTLNPDPATFDKLALAIGVFGFTDWLDGAIARKYPSQRSFIGTILDPLGDKLLVGCLTGCLAFQGSLPLAVAGVWFGRDIYLMSQTFYIRYLTCPRPVTWKKYWDTSAATIKIEPSFVSKVNTGLQIGVLMGLVFGQSSVGLDYGVVNSALMYSFQGVTCGTTLYTWWDYRTHYSKYVKGIN